MAAITKTSSGKFRAQVRRKGVSQAKTFNTKAEAKRWATTQEYQIDRQDWNDPGLLKDTTLQDVIEHYKAVKVLSNAMSTSVNNLTYLQLLPLSRLTTEKIAEFAQWRVDTHGVKPQTVGMDIVHLGNLIKYARLKMKLPISSDLIKDTRAELKSEGLICPSIERTRRPSQAELDKLMEYWQSPAYTRFPGLPMVDLVTFAIGTCMRQAEICRIRWADLDRDNKCVTIRDRKHPTKKKGNDQVIPLLGNSFEIVEAQPQTDARIFPFISGSISQNFTRTCSKLNIVDLHFHDFRREHNHEH